MSKLEKVSYTAFLIKNEYNEFDEVIEEDKYVEKYLLKAKYGLEGYFYIGHNKKNEPKWYKALKKGVNEPPNITNKSSRAVLLIKIKETIIAFTFGHGRHMLRKEVYVRDFGLKVVLNNCEVSKLKTMDTLTLDNVTAQTRTQTSKASRITEFNIDNNRELLKGIQAEARDFNRYGKNISGRDSFNFTEELCFFKLKDFCKYLMEDYVSNKYKKNFEWIDHVSEVTDPTILKELNGLLVEQINKMIQGNSNLFIHLAPTTILDMERAVEFSYTEKGDRFDELNFYDYINVKKIEVINIKKLKSDKIFVMDTATDSAIDDWSVYSTLNVEQEHADKHYILALGQWYAVDTGFLSNINKKIMEIETCPLKFHEYNHDDENHYNSSVAHSYSNIISMDKANIYVPGGRFEFCDLLSNEQHLIHVKRWDRSSTLSHLFSQGRISATSVLNMPEQIPQINKKIKENGGCEHFFLDEERDAVRNYTIVFAIIYKEDKEIHDRLPFFSKINFVHSINTLKNMQFKVQKMRIKNIA